MLEAYVAALTFGGVLVGVSAVLGGDQVDEDLDKDVDHLEVDKDLDHAIEHPPGEGRGEVAKDSAGLMTWAPWTSLRFWSFGTASFGAAGTLLSLFGFPDVVAIPLSATTGLGVGWAAAVLFRALKVDRVSADTHHKRLVGAEGEVVLPIRPGSRGRVKLLTASGVVELSARSRDGHELPIGARVLVAGVEGDQVDVTGLSTPPRVPAVSTEKGG